MQYTQHTNLLPSFKRHRSAVDHHQRYRNLDLRLPTPLPPPVWANLPSPPMSGSPPSEHPPSPHQIAGRRRKRSESPQPVTSGASAVTSTYQPAYPPYVAPPPLDRTGYGGSHMASTSLPYPPPPQQMAYVAGPSILAPIASPTTQQFPGAPISPRTTRKNKAHVASACINCKKKHLRCDNARPCRRCVQSGKEDTCEDVVHKKRGRPPLRPEDPSAQRAIESSLLTDPARRMPTTDPASYAQGGNNPRSFRPLQAYPTYDPTRAYQPGQPYGLYAAPSIGGSSTTAMGQFVQSRSYGAPIYPQAQPPYPAAGPSARPLAPYPPNYGYQNEPMRAPPPPGYSTSLFPRSQYPPPSQEAGPSPSLQLPPIRPTMERSPLDPSLGAPGDSRAQPPQADPAREGSGTTRQPDPKRPKMDIQGILGPKHD